MIKSISKGQLKRVRKRLTLLYGSDAERLLERLFMVIGRYGVGGIDSHNGNAIWDEHDSVLITYADSISDKSGESPLQSLNKFARKHLKGAFRSIHLLPFYPWSSDDGFSVIDYRKVAEENGDWRDVESLSQEFDLMFDLVMNHCSVRSPWFKDYIAGIEPARNYFIEMDPAADLSQVVRPRTSPLLTKAPTRDGETHIWTTFSSDQVDLNWKNPDVLFEFIDILMFYLSKGMRFVRMDAVAFVWKELGTSCIHLPETHELVKLFRDIVEIVAPRTVLLTETNVPHAENISYFGNGNEAQMVYQFSLPPLLLHALVKGQSRYLTKWAKELLPPPQGCTFFNFTASHDGIGVRPLEGLLPKKEQDLLIKHVRKSGGKVSSRTLADGTTSPYELNITYYSALADSSNPELGARRFICSQAVMLSLKGIPGMYLHSLTATPNDLDGVKESGINRRINRHKWDTAELGKHLKSKPANLVFQTCLQMLRKRGSHAAFHPDAKQKVFDLDEELFIHNRVSVSGDETIVCIYNFTPQGKNLSTELLKSLFMDLTSLHEILTGRNYDAASAGLLMEPYQAMWLVSRD